MELTKSKYKSTEFGLIPEDWGVFTIQSLIDGNTIISHLDGNHGALYPRSNEFTNSGVPYITANDFADGFVNFKHVRYLPISRAEQFQKGIAKDGDVLFAHNATVGPTAVLKTDLEYVILSTTATYFRTDNKNLNNGYLRYFFESQFFVQQYSAVMRQSTRNQIPITQQRKFSVILPPSLTEQKAIATALSDVDELISSLEKLIAKKKAIKQGAMQELLVPPNKGGKRLPGFSGEWEEVSLGDIGQCIIGLTYSPINVKNSGTLVLRSSNIQDGRFSSHDNVYVDSDIPEKLRVQENDILVCVRNGSRNLIGKSLKLSKVLVGQTWGAFMSVYRSSFNDYVAHLFNSNVIQRQIEENLGATINQITNKTLNSFKVCIPKDLHEQKAIAQILSDMDIEIEALEVKKAKYQDIKQGMMQELLTGKIRLV